MGHFSHLTMLLIAGVVFHAILWARNAAFLWSQRRAILLVVGVAELWMLVTDPIGGRWGAWYYDPNNILNIWIVGLPIEEWIWIAGVTLLFGCVTVVIAEPRTKNREPQA